MARKGALTFWKILREVSVSSIRKEAERRFTLALVGNSDELSVLRQVLLQDLPDPNAVAEASSMLRFVEPQTLGDLAKELRKIDLILTFSEHVPALGKQRALIILADTGPESVVQQIFDQRPDLILPLARRFPIFREEAAQREISATSRVNAEVAITSALPGVVPLTSVFIPATSVTDIILLTKNQMILLLKIAAIYGKPIHLMDRFRELLPVVGGAFGWRAVARELAGYVPAGVGVAIKGTIAYAGTVAVGKGALLFYQGKLSSRDQVDQLYQQATESGRSLVSSIIESRKTGVRSSSSE